jgi:hypothetical protein
VQPAGDHQMQNQPDIIFKADTNPFAHSAQLHYRLAFRTAKRRLYGAQQKRAYDSRALDRLTENSLF